MKHFAVLIAAIALFGLSAGSQTPSTPVQLPSQRQAVSDMAASMKAAYKTPTLDDDWKAEDIARQAEIAAIRDGHPEKVAAEDIENCQKAIVKQDTDAKTAKDKAESDARTAASDAAQAAAEAQKRKDDLRKNHCPSTVRIGITENCVYLILGYPDHTNVNVRNGRQLVYPNEKYIYIDTKGLVENIQYTE